MILNLKQKIIWREMKELRREKRKLSTVCHTELDLFKVSLQIHSKLLQITF